MAAEATWAGDVGHDTTGASTDHEEATRVKCVGVVAAEADTEAVGAVEADVKETVTSTMTLVPAAANSCRTSLSDLPTLVAKRMASRPLSRAVTVIRLDSSVARSPIIRRHRLSLSR